MAAGGGGSVGVYCDPGAGPHPQLLVLGLDLHLTGSEELTRGIRPAYNCHYTPWWGPAEVLPCSLLLSCVSPLGKAEEASSVTYTMFIVVY